jgi:hemolysin activation/secretion protein
MKRYAATIVGVCLIAGLSGISYSQTPPPSQEMGGQIRQRQMETQEEALTKRVEKKKETPEIDNKLPEGAAELPPSEKVLVKSINVTGVTLIPESDIKAITSQFENKELSLKDMQKAADLITDLYRKKGYVTSRAYLPPQKIEGDTLEIRVIEGRMGDLDVKGNYHYKTFLFKKK